MALVVDRTSEFLECLKGDELFRRLRHGNEMFVVPRREKTGFEVDSEAIERRIEGWRIRLDGYRLRYLDFLPGGMADRERDEVDADAAAAVKLTSEEIESLKERAARMSDGVNKAHRLGMVVALVESLQVVDSLARDMRGARIRQAMEKKTKQSTSASQRKRFEELPPRSVPPQLADGMQHNPAMLQALEEENRSMHNELVTTFEEVRYVNQKLPNSSRHPHPNYSQASPVFHCQETAATKPFLTL